MTGELASGNDHAFASVNEIGRHRYLALSVSRASPLWDYTAASSF